ICHCHLHSFPTRRSSDLLGDGTLLWVYYILLEDLFTTYGFSFANQPKSFYITFVVYTIGLIIALIGMNGKGLERVEQFLSRVNRSEEHTSELQSRENLVC